MKNLTHYSCAALIAASSLIATPVAAEESSVAAKDRNILVGAGSGALIGTAVAGPVGGVIGGIFGVLIGNERNHDNTQKEMTITLANYQKQMEEAQELARTQQHQYDLAVQQLRDLERQRSLVNLTEVREVDVIPIELNLQFATGSSEISSHYFVGLDEVAKRLKLNKQLSAELIGYADRTGDPKSNQVLSEHRAQSVMQYLIAQGVGQHQIEVDGYGEKQPVSQKQDMQGDFFDRRVLVRIAPTKQFQTASTNP